VWRVLLARPDECQDGLQPPLHSATRSERGRRRHRVARGIKAATCLEMKGMITETSPKPFNPFGLWSTRPGKVR